METPAYVVKKVGDKFEVVPKDALGKAEGLALIVSGALVAYGASCRGGFRGVLMTLLGSFVAYWGMQQSCLLCKHTGATERVGVRGRGASFHHEDEAGKVAQQAKDEVDEASMESFPASDAPARMARSGPAEGD